MNRSHLMSLALTALLASAAQPALAQWPAGTHRNEQGQIVTEDGRVVKGLPENDSVPNRNMHRTEQETVTEDPAHYSATPGEIE